MNAIDEILEHMIKVIRREANPDKIILFGSHLRGDSGSESDIDLLIIVSGSFGPSKSRIKEIARIERALSGVPVPTDVLVYSRDEYEKWKDSPVHVINRALAEGRVLYDVSLTPSAIFQSSLLSIHLHLNS